MQGKVSDWEAVQEQGDTWWDGCAASTVELVLTWPQRQQFVPR
jgi:hypothetical protein